MAEKIVALPQGDFITLADSLQALGDALMPSPDIQKFITTEVVDGVMENTIGTSYLRLVQHQGSVLSGHERALRQAITNGSIHAIDQNHTPLASVAPHNQPQAAWVYLARAGLMTYLQASGFIEANEQRNSIIEAAKKMQLAIDCDVLAQQTPVGETSEQRQERLKIAVALNGGNKSKTARELGMSRPRLSQIVNPKPKKSKTATANRPFG